MNRIVFRIYKTIRLLEMYWLRRVMNKHRSRLIEHIPTENDLLAHIDEQILFIQEEINIWHQAVDMDMLQELDMTRTNRKVDATIESATLRSEDGTIVGYLSDLDDRVMRTVHEWQTRR